MFPAPKNEVRESPITCPCFPKNRIILLFCSYRKSFFLQKYYFTNFIRDAFYKL